MMSFAAPSLFSIRNLPFYLTVCLFSLASPCLLVAQPQLIAPTDPLSPEEQQQKFVLPEGFEIQLVASEPTIGQPMNLHFDAAGRLWVTSSTEYPYPVEVDGLQPRPQHFPGKGEPPAEDRLTVLEGIGADGRPHQVRQLAENLNIPIGVLPLGREKALVYSIPAVWEIDGDEQRKLITGYGNIDTHGMTNSFTLGLDDWVYACHGFANDSHLVAADGSKLHLNSGNTYRFRRDGARLQQWTWGQVNPFGLTFDAWGNLYSADCHSKPLTLLLPGAYYSSFGKPHDGLGYGPDMIDHNHGSTGICGPAWYQADQFPGPYKESMYLCNPVTGRVHHDHLIWHGSSPQVQSQADFITCEDPWFRPVDAQLGPDGALYIADFYNSIIGHYEVPLDHPKRDRKRGRIWRVVYTGDGKPSKGPVDLTQKTLDELVAMLDHPNLKLRRLATIQLKERADRDVLNLQGLTVLSPAASAQALWVLERRHGLSEKQLEILLQDEQELVQSQLAQLLGNRESWRKQDRQAISKLLRKQSAMTRRFAVQAVGRHPSSCATDDFATRLREIITEAPAEDTHLIHSGRIALRNLLKENPALWQSLPESLPQRVASIALGVPSAEAAHFLVHQRDSRQLSAEEALHIGRHASEEDWQILLDNLRDWRIEQPEKSSMLYRNLAEGARRVGRSQQVFQAHASELAGTLLNEAELNVSRVEVAATLVREMQLTSHRQRLRELVGMRMPGFVAAADALVALKPEFRLKAMVPLLADPALPEELKDRIVSVILDREDEEVRETLKLTLGALPADKQLAMAERLFATQEGAALFLDLVEKGKASPRHLQRQSIQQRAGALNNPELNQRIGKLTANLPAEDEQLAQLLKQRVQGYSQSRPSVAHGRKLFEKNCANCHRIGEKGSLIGPQLDGVGIRSASRLIEDLLAPNRNVDAAFRTSTLVLQSGEVETGLIRREEQGELVLADAKGKEKRIPESNVEIRKESTLSLMPANFEETLTEQDLYDLIAFLGEQRSDAKRDE